MLCLICHETLMYDQAQRTFKHDNTRQITAARCSACGATALPDDTACHKCGSVEIQRHAAIPDWTTKDARSLRGKPIQLALPGCLPLLEEPTP